MEETSKTISKKPQRRVLLTVFILLIVMAGVAMLTCYQVIQAEAYSRYIGIKNTSAEKVSKIIRGTEMNANNVFDEVSMHLDDPEEVIVALKSKVNLNLDVRGYFAAFVPDYFPEKGTWFEPYIYQPDYGGFEYRQVGSARHNYTKSEWYIRAKNTGETFWSDPYYYYDGTSMSGHYCTFIKPIYDAKGELACVCGADMKFEWLAKELEWVDDVSKSSSKMNKYHLLKDFDFYSVILSNDGKSIASPAEKQVNITDEDVISDLAQNKRGTFDMDVDGVPCRIYYGPIEFVDWSLAIVVPQIDIWKPMIPVGALLILTAVIGIIIVWLVCRKYSQPRSA